MRPSAQIVGRFVYALRGAMALIAIICSGWWSITSLLWRELLPTRPDADVE